MSLKHAYIIVSSSFSYYKVTCVTRMYNTITLIMVHD